MSGEARFGFSHIDDGGLTFKIRRIPQLGESPPWGPVGRRGRVVSRSKNEVQLVRDNNHKY